MKLVGPWFGKWLHSGGGNTCSYPWFLAQWPQHWDLALEVVHCWSHWWLGCGGRSRAMSRQELARVLQLSLAPGSQHHLGMAVSGAAGFLFLARWWRWQRPLVL